MRSWSERIVGFFSSFLVAFGKLGAEYSLLITEFVHLGLNGKLNNFLRKSKYRFACFRTVGRSMGLETIAYQLRYYKCCCYETFVSCAGSVVEIRGAESFPFKLQWKKGGGSFSISGEAIP